MRWLPPLALALAACVELPTQEQTAPVPLDASPWVQDAGAHRPPTAEGPPAPGCGEASGTAGAGSAGLSLAPGDGGLASPVGPSASPAASATSRPVRAPSEIVITELMPNPELVRDDQGEWIELYNPSTSAALDLGGCAIDDGGASKVLAEALVLAPGGYATLARSQAAGFSPTRTLSFSLANEADSIALLCEGVIIDRVVYGAGYPLAPGISMALDAAALDAASNDDPAAWCLSPRSTYAEQGTPGAPNGSCHGDDDAGP
jgi:hypothetical protein